MKIAVIGGGGLRTPLLIHGIAHAGIGASEVFLYDVDCDRARVMAGLGTEIARESGMRVTAAAGLDEAVEGATFVLSSIRAGGMRARARDERIAIEHGLAGQETTGPCGLAMALRTIPVALGHARLVERRAPGAWLINFTNPAGLITQALMGHSGARVIGICDTPNELFHRIAWSLGEPYEHMEFRYAGLNHLGWVRSILLRGEDVTARLLGDDTALQRLYPAALFAPALIRVLGLIPTEYVFFYYSQHKAWQNQRTAGASRGEELLKLNENLFAELRGDGALAAYRNYLNRRNASYMRLEGGAESAFAQPEHDWDPFEGATGYHRIAVDVMAALSGDRPSRIVVNVRNQGAIEDLAAEDVVEVPCLIDRFGPRPLATGRLPSTIRGLTIAVKEYERLAIRAAVEKSRDLALLALLVNPLIGQWEIGTQVLNALLDADPEYLRYLTPRAT